MMNTEQRVVLKYTDQDNVTVNEMFKNITKVRMKLKIFKYCSDLYRFTPYNHRFALQLLPL